MPDDEDVGARSADRLQLALDDHAAASPVAPASSRTTAHTPGPWAWRHTPGVPDELEIVAVADRLQVASAWGGLDFNDDTDPTMHANARLIAAAPELLAALKAFVTINRRSAAVATFANAEAAIAKAEGS
jgi:hypothetical protein